MQMRLYGTDYVYRNDVAHYYCILLLLCMCKDSVIFIFLSRVLDFFISKFHVNSCGVTTEEKKKTKQSRAAAADLHVQQRAAVYRVYNVR